MKEFEELRYVILLSTQYQKLNFCCKSKTKLCIGVIHKLRLQEGGGVVQKFRLFVNVHKVENVNGGGYLGG